MVAGGWIYARCMYFVGVVLFPLLLLFIFLFFSFLFPNPAREWRKRLDEQGSMEMQPMLLCSRLFREYKTPYCTMQYSILPYDSALKKTFLFFFFFFIILFYFPAKTGAWLRRPAWVWLMYIMDDRPAVIGGQHAPRRRFNGLNQIELFSWSRRKALRVCKRSSGPVELPHCREGCWTVRSTDDGGGGGGHECCCCSTPATHANHHAHHQANKIVAMQLLDDYS